MLKNCPLGNKNSHSCWTCFFVRRDGRRGHPDYTESVSEPAAERLCHLTLTNAEVSVIYKALIHLQYNSDPEITDEQFELASQIMNKIAEDIEL